jgi:2-dehydropantoate 2-reductase
MRILVMGAGAMGSVVGGMMARAGHAVTLVGRAAHMDAIAARGLHITGIWGDHIVRALDTRTSVDGLKAGDFDVVFISVKSFDTRAAMDAVSPVLDGATLVCAYQNGLGNAEVIAEFAGWERTVGVRAIYGVICPEPGAAHVTVIANPTALGVYDNAAPADRVRALAAAMDEAGLPTVYSEKIRTVLWGKVTYNCALNPLSALLDVPYGGLAETEHTRSLLREIVHEVYTVAAAMDVPLEPATPEDYVTHLFDDLIPPTAAHYASMHEDLARGRRTEIDALNGAICRYGDERGVACPVNSFLTRLIKAREYENQKR